MIDLSKVATALTEVEPGLWTSNGNANVSYPVDAHKALAEIEDTSFWFTHRAAVIGTVLSRYPPNGHIFDVGGGNGYMVRELRARGIEAIRGARRGWRQGRAGTWPRPSRERHVDDGWIPE